MNTEKQRIAIAEACGHGDYGTRMNGWHDDQIESLPDYLNDLNAMHKAEKVLTEEQRVAYSNHTYDVACKAQRETEKWRWISLTAAQRAEAFLRTIGKWEDDK
jgi:hypothetical protein